uniref:Thiosulfate sulfurtransferase n=1 Tax=Magallana gigas TaxID=29159 RepID=K1PJK1_MAGGI
MSYVYDCVQSEYYRAHIPHALYFDLYKCCTGTKEIPLNLPEPECWTRYIQSLGVSSDTQVVVYDGQNMRLALRTWWLFRLFGHENVSVLDGGLIKWAEDGYEITVEEPTVKKPGNFQCKLNKSLMRTFEDMQKNAKNGAEQVVDVRDSKSFEGVVGDSAGENTPECLIRLVKTGSTGRKQNGSMSTHQRHIGGSCNFPSV